MLDLSIVSASNSSAQTTDEEEELPGSGLLGRLFRKGNQEAKSEDAVLNGTLYSSNCGISLQINATTTHIEVYEAKGVNYTFMVTALTFVQVCCLLLFTL